MKVVLIFVLISLGFAHEMSMQRFGLKFDSCVYLYDPLPFYVHWNLDLSNQRIYFGIQSFNVSWMGIGISLDGYMDSWGDGSDIIVSWVDEKNCPEPSYTCVGDYWASDIVLPDYDSSQDVHLEHSSSMDGITQIRFSRDLVTNDTFDRDFPTDESFILIWAIGDTIPESPTSFSQHIAYGAVRINLNNPYVCPTLSSGSMSMSPGIVHHVPMENSMPVMKTWFSASNSINILFPGWKTDTNVEYFGSLLVIILLAFIYHSVSILYNIVFLKFSVCKQEKYLTLIHLLSVFGRVIEAGLSYLLMLAIMTFDVGIFLCALLGIGIAQAVWFHFEWKKRYTKKSFFFTDSVQSVPMEL